MTTAQDYLTYKAAFILSLEARQRSLKFASPRWMQVSDAISAQFKRWDAIAKAKVIQRMAELKSQHPKLDWEREWTKV